jgi:hypothetical protein
MRATLSAVLLAFGLLLHATGAFAFCVYNGLRDRDVQAALIPMGTQRPAKIYGESVAPGKESCCNPRSAECNPDRLQETETTMISFEARVLASQGAAAMPQANCGLATSELRFPSRAWLQVPLRGSLLFEANPKFDARLPAAATNPQFVAKALAPNKSLVAMYPCAPGLSPGRP